MGYFKKLDFSIKATAHQNILRRMKVERTDNALMLVAVICIYQFLKVKVSRFEKNFFFTVYSRVGLQKSGNWIYLVLNTGYFASGVLCCFAWIGLRPVEELC